MAKQAMLLDFHNVAFKNFQLDVVQPLSTESLPLHKLKFLIKKGLQNFVSQATTHGICCLLCRKMNESKII